MRLLAKQGSMKAVSAPASAPFRLAWAVFSGLAALLVGIGLSRFGYTPLVPVLIRAGWLDSTQAAYAGAANLAGYLIGAVAISRLHRPELELLLTRLALTACTVSFIACAHPLGLAWFSGWRGLSGIAGAVLMILTPHRVLAVAPVRWRGRIAGVMFLGVGLGIALSASITPWILRLGLPQTWICLASLSALLAGLAWWGFPKSSMSVKPCSAPLASEAKPAAAASLATHPGTMLVVAAYSLSAAGYAPHTVFWVDFIARGLGAGMRAGAANWLLFGLAATAAPLLLGLLADRIGFAAAFRLSLLVSALSAGLPLVSTAPWSLALSSLGVGGLQLGCSSLDSARLTGLLPEDRRRLVWGWMTTGYSVFYAAGGYGASYLFGHTASYVLLFGIGAATLAAAALVDSLASLTTGARP
ncbi:MAG: YbfB/YjiJ family MFS transporter [SAR324 cluster bacterium]